MKSFRTTHEHDEVKVWIGLVQVENSRAYAPDDF